MTDLPEIWQDNFIERVKLPAGKLAERFNILNPRTHPEEQSDAVEESLNTAGWFDDISLSTNGDGPPSLDDNPDAVMFDGHKRVELALVKGGPDALVPVRWYRLTPEETDFALLVKDQTTAMAGIDAERMGALMQRAKALTAAPGLQGMMARLKEQVAEGMLGGNGKGASPEPKIDKAAELQEIWQVRLGDVWEIEGKAGIHRVICGDCTDRAVVDRVMGGEKADGIITDPPYSFGMASMSNDAIKSKGWFDLMNNSEWFKLRYLDYKNQLKIGGIWVCINWRTLPILMRASFDSGVFIDSVMVWYKDWIGPGGQKGLRPTYELVAFSAIGDYSIPSRGVEDFFKAEWSSHKPSGHKAEKPVKLFKHLLEISEFDIVYDPFLGSGTTMIAAENLGRLCRGIEIHPPYVAVTLQRAQDAGLTPRRIAHHNLHNDSQK